MLIDTHCHLASGHFHSVEKDTIINNARNMGVDEMISLGSCFEDWQPTLEWARQFPGTVHSCLGIHPNDAHEAPGGWGSELTRLAGEYPLAAIGEAGLDYYHPAPDGYDDDSFRKIQQNLLEEHFEIASRLGLNIVLHTRDKKGSASFDDVVAIARPYAGKVRSVFHCFIGTKEQASLLFDDLDALISITGIATFKNPGHVADVVTWCPDDRFMLETDSPYLSPEPKRGRTNEPAYLSYLAERVAQMRGITVKLLGDLTTRTARQFYRLG